MTLITQGVTSATNSQSTSAEHLTSSDTPQSTFSAETCGSVTKFLQIADNTLTRFCALLVYSDCGFGDAAWPRLGEISRAIQNQSAAIRCRYRWMSLHLASNLMLLLPNRRPF